MSAAPENNLLSVLHRWASRQDENFVTDAFAHLVQRLLIQDEFVGLNIIRQLSSGRLSGNMGDGASVKVNTQVTVKLGRPDIEISSPNHLIYVESKVESGLGNRQLERYLEELDAQKPAEASTLVVLSRYPVNVEQNIRDRVIAVRWYQVAHWLVEQLERSSIQDAINKFLAEQFIGFLESRNMTMEKVGPELTAGVRSFRSLIAMVTETISATRTSMDSSFGRDWAGYYFDNKKFFFGVYYERPHVVVFETKLFPVVADGDKRLGYGSIERDGTTPNKRKWVNPLVLNSDETRFFELSREGQMEVIEGFLAQCLGAASKIQDGQ